MNIVTAPNPLLRQKCLPCEVGDPSLKQLGQDMLETMYESDGCGLAAPQVGLLKRIITIDCGIDQPEPHVLINPEIVKLDGPMTVEEEGCLSLPGISVPVKRPAYACVSYYDVDGNQCTIEGDGLLGRCLQHEIDHLEGRTLFESSNPLARIKALRDYEAAQAAGARPGDTSI